MTINYENYSILKEQLSECITKKNLPQIQKQIYEIVSSCSYYLESVQICFIANCEFAMKEYQFESLLVFEQFIAKQKEDIITSVKFDLNPISDLLKDMLPQFSLYKINKILDFLHVEMMDLYVFNMNKSYNELIEKYINGNKQLTFTCSNYLASSATPANMVSFYNSKMDVLASISNDGILTFKADANDQNTKDFIKCIETLGVKITGMSLI